jgi:hypothetical protein
MELASEVIGSLSTCCQVFGSAESRAEAAGHQQVHCLLLLLCEVFVTL